jgi:hypothetical protein
MPIPDSIAGAPQLRPGLEHYWDAFSDLTGERQLGFGAPGPIPWSAKMQWARYHRMSREETDVLLFLVDRMDECFLEHMARKLDKD